MWTARIAVLATLYFSLAVNALGIVGCTGTTVGLSTVAQAGAYVNEAACASACSSLYRYAFYNQANQACRCGNIAPAASALAQATASASLGLLAAGCASTSITPSQTVLDLTITDNVFLRLCIIASVLGTGSVNGELPGSAGSPGTCINSCKALNRPYSLIAGDYSSCRCAASISTSVLGAANLLTCPLASTSGSYRVYADVNLIPDGSTVLKKREAYGKINRRKFAATRYCPGQLSACKVAGAVIGDEYECIDSSAELESCGGCMAGWAQAPQGRNETVGTDCSAIPGVAIGGVTCNSGHCQISACQNGWKRVDNTCVDLGLGLTGQRAFNQKLIRQMRASSKR